MLFGNRQHNPMTNFSFVSTTALLLAATSLPAGIAAEPSKTRWVNVLGVGIELLNLKKTIAVSDRVATSVFAEKYPLLRDGWRPSLPSQPEVADDARQLPRFREGEFQPAKDPISTPMVIRFTDRTVEVAIVRPVGSYLWHHYYDCLARVELNRTQTIDHYFQMARLESTFGANLKGISQGSTAKDVEKAFGKPDQRRETQAVDCYEYTYDKAAIKVWFVNDRVMRIDPIKEIK